MVKILVMPDWRAGNPYLDLLETAVRLVRPDLTFLYADFSSGLFSLMRNWVRVGRPGVVHLHWLNDWIAPLLWPKSSAVAMSKLLIVLAQIASLRLAGVRVILTLHNRVSHESLNPQREIWVVGWIAKLAAAVTVHSAQASELIRATYPNLKHRSIEIVPHPNYDGCYATPTEVQHALNSATGPAIRVLFFGALRRYKGAEAAISAVKRLRRQDILLTVAGKPIDDQMAAALVQAAESDPRISLRLAEVPSDQVFSLFASSDVVVVPFRLTLTSGSVVLALTMGRPVISTPEAKILGLIDESNGFLCDAEQLGPLLESLDVDELRGMRNGARNSAERLDARFVGPALLSVYGLLEESAKA